MGYLKEILTGDYKDYKEDRLSQIFSSSFNHSHLFRKVFFRTIKLNIKTVSEYKCRTQINYKVNQEDARIDIIIYRKAKPFIVIENKVDAELKPAQLKRYDEIKELKACKYKYALVKHYFESFEDLADWNIVHWSDLYAEFKKKENSIADKIDLLIIQNFLEHLEQLNMARVNIITGNELLALSSFFYNIKYMDYSKLSINSNPMFDVGSKYVSMLEEITENLRGQTFIKKVLAKNFRCSPKIDVWGKDSGDANWKRSFVMEFKLNKTINNLDWIGTGLLFHDSLKKSDVIIYGMTKDLDWEREAYYKGKDLVFEKYMTQVFNCWEKWLTT